MTDFKGHYKPHIESALRQGDFEHKSQLEEEMNAGLDQIAKIPEPKIQMVDGHGVVETEAQALSRQRKKEALAKKEAATALKPEDRGATNSPSPSSGIGSASEQFGQAGAANSNAGVANMLYGAPGYPNAVPAFAAKAAMDGQQAWATPSPTPYSYSGFYPTYGFPGFPYQAVTNYFSNNAYGDGFGGMNPTAAFGPGTGLNAGMFQQLAGGAFINPALGGQQQQSWSGFADIDGLQQQQQQQQQEAAIQQMRGLAAYGFAVGGTKSSNFGQGASESTFDGQQESGQQLVGEPIRAEYVPNDQLDSNRQARNAFMDIRALASQSLNPVISNFAALASRSLTAGDPLVNADPSVKALLAKLSPSTSVGNLEVQQPSNLNPMLLASVNNPTNSPPLINSNAAVNLTTGLSAGGLVTLGGENGNAEGGTEGEEAK